MRNFIHRKNRKGEIFLLGEISEKMRSHSKYKERLHQLKVFHPKSNTIDETDSDIFFFEKREGDYYLIKDLGFSSPETDGFLINAYHPLLKEHKDVTIGKFIQHIYNEYFFDRGTP